MLLKKYKNRKLYSIMDSQYVNFKEIDDAGVESLYVHCDKTKQDITKEILCSMLANRLMTMTYADAMVRSNAIITRLNNYVPNMAALQLMSRRAKRHSDKYWSKTSTEDLQDIIA